MLKLRTLASVLAISLTLTSCAKNKATRAFRLPPTPAPAALPSIPTVADPPQIAEVQPQGPPSPEALSTLSPPLEPFESSNRRARRHSPAPPAPTAGASPPAPTANQPMRLGSMFTPEQQREFTHEINANIYRARHNLLSVSKRHLNADQKETADQIEVFLKQAQAAMASDLEAARSLAERAELLSRDLLRSLR